MKTFTFTNKHNTTNPRAICSVEFRAPEGDISQKLNMLERDSVSLVKDVPRVNLSRFLLNNINDDSDSESDFEDDLDDDNKWLATYVQDNRPVKRRSSTTKYNLSSTESAPVKRRSSVKFTVPLKEAPKPKVRGNRIIRLFSKRTTKQKDDIQTQAIRDTRRADSLRLHRERLQRNKLAKST